jgi:hypothetical protein
LCNHDPSDPDKFLYKFQQIGETMRMRRFLALFSSLAIVVTASAQILTCSSNNGKRNWCYGKTANGVRLVRQISGSPCIQGTSWGYGTVAIWVDHGCRADFALNAGVEPSGKRSSS